MRRLITKIGLLGSSLAVMGATSLAVAAAPNSHANAAAVNATSGNTSTTGSPAGTKLAEAKLRVCHSRETAIDNILSRIADRGQKQLDLFTTIATRTETFYTNKGKTLSDYSTLVAAVNTNKAAAQTTIDTIKADSVSFKCDGTDPKGAISSFKTALKDEIAALKAYRTSVKNLIVGVKSVQSTTTSTSSNTTSGGQ